MKIDKENFNKNLGKKIKYFQELRCLTLEQLAKLADCTGSYIALIEKGRNTPNSYVLYKLAQSLYVPLLYLYGLEEKEEEINLKDDPIFHNNDFEPYLEIAKEAYFSNISSKELKRAIKILNKF
jgi:transcriptional regulator with XRE-family HTH domain